MSAAPHTLGVWRAAEWTSHAAITVLADQPDGRMVVVAECGGSGRHSDESLGDAKLMAAAKELLAALQAILPWHDSHPAEATDSPLINQCRDAIAKATGSAS